MNAPLLLFGAEGQVGSEILYQASRTDRGVVGFSHKEVDITDRVVVEDAIRQTRPGLVINAAAYTAVDKAETEPQRAHQVNAIGAEIVAKAAAANNIPILHFSTDFVFDGAKAGAYVESDRIDPLGVYGRTKADGEDRVRTVTAMHIIVRTAWVFGAYGNNFLKTILRLAQERDELLVVADQYGSPTATIDIAHAVFEIDRNLSSGRASWGTYHFAGKEVTTWYDFASAIVDIQKRFTGRDPLVRSIRASDWPSKVRRPSNSALDSSLFASRFGFSAAPWQERTAQVVASLMTSRSGTSQLAKGKRS